MGTSRTPHYVVEMSGLPYGITPAEYKGVLTVDALRQYVMDYVVSTMPGFMNEPVSAKYGIVMPSKAIVRENKPGGRTIMEWKAAAFQVLPDPKDFPHLMTMDRFWSDTVEHLKRTMHSDPEGEVARRKAVHDANLVTA